MDAGRPEPGTRPNEGEIVAETGGTPIARYAADEPRRSTKGEIETMCMYAGRGVGQITSVEPAAEIVARMGSKTRHSGSDPFWRGFPRPAQMGAPAKGV